jgi:acyl-CoA thioesterase FadM
MNAKCLSRRYRAGRATRLFSTSVRYAQGPGIDPTKGNAARWLSEVKGRLGKCLSFGTPASLMGEATALAGELGRSWREIVAGSEGFVTDPQRAGLHRQPIVWGDQDSMGHVNNVMYVRWAESGRCNWTRKFRRFDPAHKHQWEEVLTPRNVGLILKSIKVDFKFPMNWPDKISVYHKLNSRPDENTASMMLDVMILSEAKQRPAARCLEDVVVYDYKVAKKTALPSYMLRQFQSTWELQQQARQKGLAAIRGIEDRLRFIEQQTWDRPDAKEDFGGQTP